MNEIRECSRGAIPHRFRPSYAGLVNRHYVGVHQDLCQWRRARSPLSRRRSTYSARSSRSVLRRLGCKRKNALDSGHPVFFQHEDSRLSCADSYRDSWARWRRRSTITSPGVNGGFRRMVLHRRGWKDDGTGRKGRLEVRSGFARALFDTHLEAWLGSTVNKDGRFLLPTQIEKTGHASMNVVVNWTAGLKK